MRRESTPPQSLCSQDQSNRQQQTPKHGVFQSQPPPPHWPILDLLASPVQSSSSPQQLRRLRTPSGESAQPLRQCIEFDRPTAAASAAGVVAATSDEAAVSSSSATGSPSHKKVTSAVAAPEAAAAAAAAATVLVAPRPPTLSRNRGGSLRGSPVLRVLPDRALPSKANSSESLSSADLSSLTSLVQRKRQESPEPQHPQSAWGGRTARGPTTGVGPSGQSQESEDSSESPAEDHHHHQQQQPPPQSPAGLTGEAADAAMASAGGSAGCLGQSGLSLEFLMLDAQSRTAPQIRQPSARPVKSDQQHQQKLDGSRGGSASGCGLGSSPPKAVSFNLNHEVNTFEEESSDHRRRKSRHHHQHSVQHQHPAKGRKPDAAAFFEGKISDSQLIEAHSAMIDTMLSTVRKQLDYLSLVKEGRIGMEYYRDMMKNLLSLQTKTIQQILDAIQSNEKNS